MALHVKGRGSAEPAGRHCAIRRVWRRLAIGALPCLFAVPALAERVAFVDVTVLPMEGAGRLLHQTVLVENGTIKAITAARAAMLPRGTRRIDGRGRYLMPGLSDMHAHLDWNLSALGADALTPEAHRRLVLLSYLATGVTLVREMTGSPTRLKDRAAIDGGRKLGPKIIVATPILEGAKPVWGGLDPRDRPRCGPGPDQAAQERWLRSGEGLSHALTGRV